MSWLFYILLAKYIFVEHKLMTCEAHFMWNIIQTYHRFGHSTEIQNYATNKKNISLHEIQVR